MCTFIVAWQVFDGYPVVVAANRDEAVDRPSTPPAVISEDPRIVAPVDDRAGGTWIGYNEYGLVVSVTNRWTDADLTGERSRGLLVRDALACESVAAVRDLLDGAVETDAYDGFNLVALDRSDARVFEWDGTLTETAFEPGIHVVVNVGADHIVDLPEFPTLDPEDATRRREAARTQAESARRVLDDLGVRAGENVQTWLTRVNGVLTDHDYGFCVHGEDFGTRSSSVLRVPAEGEPRYEFADGQPCADDVSYLSVNTK
jgi:uncharacterized protein with NRDE domain